MWLKHITPQLVQKQILKPAELVFGKGAPSSSYMDLEKLIPPHHLVKNKAIHIETLTKDIKEMTTQAKERIDKIRLVTQEKLNKTRVDKGLKINDYVFVKDRTEIIGAPRPLKTKINPSPYVVLAVKHSTVLVKRLSDGFISLYSQDDVKKYDKNSKLFADLPKKVGEVLLHDFTDLLENDFTTLMKYDPLETPIGVAITSKIAKTNSKKNDNQNLSDDEIAKQLENEQLEKDIIELQNDPILKEAIPVNSEESESESETENEQEGWKGRLRPRKTKITFKK